MSDYKIKYSDSSKGSITVKENTIYNDGPNFGLDGGFIGHNQPEYGVSQNTNFLHLLENFASNEEPTNPIVGQIWYEKNDDDKNFELKVFDSEKWVPLSKINVYNEDDIEQYSNYTIPGELCYNTLKNELYAKSNKIEGNKWVKIGPVDTTDVERIDVCDTLHYDDVNSIVCTIPLDNDIEDTSSEENNSEQNNQEELKGNGALYLVKLNILAKEFIDGEDYSPYVDSCGWIYKFLVRIVKTNNGHEISKVGEENYELIGKSDDSIAWKNRIEVYNNNPDEHGVKITFDKDSVHLQQNHYITVKFDAEIIKV